MFLKGKKRGKIKTNYQLGTMDNNTLNTTLKIIGAFGSLATFGTFIILLIKDKAKQTQIDKLTGIASILEAQNETMKAQNDLMAQQVDIIRNNYLLKNNETNAILDLKKIDEKRLKLNIKPNLWLNRSGHDGSGGHIKFQLNNKGEDAKILDIIMKSVDVILLSSYLPFDLDKDGTREIICNKIGSKHIKDCEYEIEIIYTDKLDNKYSSIIKGKGSQVNIIETKEIDNV